MEQSTLMQMFPEGSGNLRMENFSPAWFLLENHMGTRLFVNSVTLAVTSDFTIISWCAYRSVDFFCSLFDLRRGLNNLAKNIDEEDSNADIHRANLYALINCVDALAACHSRMQREKNTRGWPLTQTIYEKVIQEHDYSLL